MTHQIQSRRGGRRGPPPARTRRRRGGAARAPPGRQGRCSSPFIRRKLKNYEVLDEEGLSLIEANTDLILEEIGIEFRDDEEALAMWREAGADVKGTRVHFPRGLCRSLIKTAPKTFTQHARNPERSRRDRRQRHRLRAGLRAALRARPRQGPPLRHHRGFPQFREARLPGAGHPPFRRHRVRAGRRARQQAAPRHGLFAHPLFRQTVHGLGHASGARDGFRHHGGAGLRQGVRRPRIA